MEYFLEILRSLLTENVDVVVVFIAFLIVMLKKNGVTVSISEVEDLIKKVDSIEKKVNESNDQIVSESKQIETKNNPEVY